MNQKVIFDNPNVFFNQKHYRKAYLMNIFQVNFMIFIFYKINKSNKIYYQNKLYMKIKDKNKIKIKSYLFKRKFSTKIFILEQIFQILEKSQRKNYLSQKQQNRPDQQCSLNVRFQCNKNVEFHFILQDIKSELASIPPLQSLLKLTQKTTKKLQCINLYSQMDKRQFDMEIEQENIYTEITQLYKAISSVLTDKPPTPQEIIVIETSIDEIRQKYSSTFDALNRQQQILNMEFTTVQNFLKQTQMTGTMMIKQAKQIDQYELQDEQNLNKNYPNDDLQNQNDFNDPLIEPPQLRIQKLKHQIENINKKIAHLNHGKGKWFDTDHKDFLKIYNKCNGVDTKIINEAIKILGMNQTQIMDHLELYQNYLQLQKQKKLVSEEYRQIKLLQDQENREKQQQKQQLKKIEAKLKKQKQIQQRLKKKQEIQKYKQKKLQEKEKMIQKQEQQKQKFIKIPPIQPQKKRQILERNRIMMQNQQKKILQMKIKRQSMQKGKLINSQQKKASLEVKKNPNVPIQSKKIISSSTKIVDKSHLNLQKEKKK